METVVTDAGTAGKNTITGGCYCGAIRYEIAAAPIYSTVCHCSNCRRSVGAQSVAWVTVARHAFRWVSGGPARRQSETGAWWEFCSECGTTLTYERDERPDDLDVTAGSLDIPEAFPPTFDVCPDEKLGWVQAVAAGDGGCDG